MSVKRIATSHAHPTEVKPALHGGGAAVARLHKGGAEEAASTPAPSTAPASADSPPERPAQSGGLLGAMHDWVSTGAYRDLARQGVDKLTELASSPAVGDFKDKAMALPVVGMLGNMHELMGRMKKEGLTPESHDQLNKLLADGQKYMRPEFLEAARRVFPDNPQISRQSIDAMKDHLASSTRDLATIHRVTAEIAGRNGRLDTGDVRPAVNALMRDPQFRGQVMRSAHDGLSQIAKGPIREAIGHRLLDRFPKAVMKRAPDAIAQGGVNAMRRLGMAEGRPDGQSRELDLDDLRALHAAARRLSGQPPASLESAIHQQLVHKLQGGADPTARDLQGQMGRQGRQAIDRNGFLDEHDRARDYVQQVFEQTLQTLPERLHSAGPDDIKQLWSTSYNAWKLLDSLQPTMF